MDEISRIFGHEAADPRARRARIRPVIQDIAPRHDPMSGGLHRLWKSRVTKHPLNGRDGHAADLAGETVPFADRSVETVTRAFGLRNMTDPNTALVETFRILASAGGLLIREFSKPVRWFASFYRAISRAMIPAMGAIVTHHRGAYRYLVESIAGVPNPAMVGLALDSAKCGAISVQRLFFAVAASHVATKPTG